MNKEMICTKDAVAQKVKWATCHDWMNVTESEPTKFYNIAK